MNFNACVTIEQSKILYTKTKLTLLRVANLINYFSTQNVLVSIHLIELKHQLTVASCSYNQDVN